MEFVELLHTIFTVFSFLGSREDFSEFLIWNCRLRVYKYICKCK